MLVRKLVVYQFECRNIFYLMFESLSISSLGQERLVETICYSKIVKWYTLLRKLKQRKKKRKKCGWNISVVKNLISSSLSISH